MRTRTRPAGFTIAELLAVIILLLISLAVVMPVLARTRSASGVTVSLNNLINLGVAHELYSADWNGRQVTTIVDNFSTYGSSGVGAVTNYYAVNHVPHPGLRLGFCNGGEWGYWFPVQSTGFAGNWVVITPFDFSTQFGYFRIANSSAFHDYVGGRFYEETFYAPNDTAVYPDVSPLFNNPCGFVNVSTVDPHWSSYCLSPAALFNPAVMRAHSAGGWQDPFSLSNGFTSPNSSQALYPALKTRMLEHHWNQNQPPNICNPYLSGGNYSNCEPYYFNHALASTPATLFYDGHVRLLPNAEVIAADQQILTQTKGVDGLWSRDTSMGTNGYFGQYSIDGTIVSHHILTTNGIRGRDTLGQMPVHASVSDR